MWVKEYFIFMVEYVPSLFFKDRKHSNIWHLLLQTQLRSAAFFCPNLEGTTGVSSYSREISQGHIIITRYLDQAVIKHCVDQWTWFEADRPNTPSVWPLEQHHLEDAKSRWIGMESERLKGTLLRFWPHLAQCFYEDTHSWFHRIPPIDS